MIFVPKKNIYFPKYQRGNFAIFPAGTTALIGGPVIEFTGDPYAIFDVDIAPNDARSEIEIQSDGDVFAFRLANSDFLLGTWNSGGAVIADYDFMFQIVSGTLSPIVGNDAANVFVNGSVIPRWGVEMLGSSIKTCTGNIRVRPAGGGADIDQSLLVTLEAETSP